jgi:hypothetical protein
MKKTHRNCKNHTKNAKNDISGITDILPGFSPYWLSPITSFHHIGDNRYYRDILESVTSLNPVPAVLFDRSVQPCNRTNQTNRELKSPPCKVTLTSPTDSYLERMHILLNLGLVHPFGLVVGPPNDDLCYHVYQCGSPVASATL